MMFWRSLSGITVLALFVSLISVSTAEARTVVRSGDRVSVTEEQEIQGDFYTSARIVNISGVIENDLVAAAQSLTINGSVGDNAFILALDTDVSGAVGDDLRIIGQTVTITEPITGDLFVIGGTVNLLSTASVGGDVLVYANEVVLEGSVGGDVLGTIDSLRVDAPIGGDVNVTVNQLTLGERTEVTGNVTYKSGELLVQALDATVAGDVVRNDPVLPGNQTSVRLALVPSFILLFSVLAWYLIARSSLQAVTNRALSKSLKPVFYGTLVLLFGPLVAIVLMASVIGILVGMAAFLMYFLLIVSAVIASAAVAGQLAMRLLDKSNASLGLVGLCSGVIIVTMLMLLPFVGQIAFVALVILSVGSMVSLVIEMSHRRR